MKISLSPIKIAALNGDLSFSYMFHEASAQSWKLYSDDKWGTINALQVPFSLILWFLISSSQFFFFLQGKTFTDDINFHYTKLAPMMSLLLRRHLRLLILLTF